MVMPCPPHVIIEDFSFAIAYLEPWNHLWGLFCVSRGRARGAGGRHNSENGPPVVFQTISFLPTAPRDNETATSPPRPNGCFFSVAGPCDQTPRFNSCSYSSARHTLDRTRPSADPRPLACADSAVEAVVHMFFIIIFRGWLQCNDPVFIWVLWLQKNARCYNLLVVNFFTVRLNIAQRHMMSLLKS